MPHPVVILPYNDTRPGWLARLVAWLALWAWRLFAFLVIFALGYGCRALTG